MNQTASIARLPRSQIVITGKDRVRLLHGLTTNDIKRLQPGDGCETFLTNIQGKVIGYVYVFCTGESLILDSVAGQAPDIIRALDRYVIREDAKFTDQSQAWSELLIFGDQAAKTLAAVFGDLPSGTMQHREVPWATAIVSIRRTHFAGPGAFQLSVVSELIADVETAIVRAGAESCSEQDVEIARIEAGTPLFGRDVTSENLPQEVDRNVQAISFTKGCYLGQETVARIDALGHVNRTLRALRFDSSEIPPAGADIEKDGKTIAKITSACFSPSLSAPLAIAYVRRGQEQYGNRFSSNWGTAEVIRFPRGDGAPPLRN